MWLLIDDLRNFRQEVIPENVEVLIARNSEQGLAILEKYPEGFDKVFFDHDLGGNDTVRIVVLKLEELNYFNDSPYPIGEIIVHTSNSVGGDWIMSALKNIYPTRRVFAGDYFTD